MVNTASTNWTLAISKGCRASVDAGQCNDAYSAIILAVTLAEKLGCGVNDLPLSLVLSPVRTESDRHPADAAVAGCEKHRHRSDGTGFFTPDLLAVLNEKFGLRSVTTVEQDMQQLLSA